MKNNWVVEVICKEIPKVEEKERSEEAGGGTYMVATFQAVYRGEEFNGKTEFPTLFCQVYGDGNIKELQREEVKEGTRLLLDGQRYDHSVPYTDKNGNIYVNDDGNAMYQCFRKIKCSGVDAVKILAGSAADGSGSAKTSAGVISAAELAAKKAEKAAQYTQKTQQEQARQNLQQTPQPQVHQAMPQVSQGQPQIPQEVLMQLIAAQTQGGGQNPMMQQAINQSMVPGGTMTSGTNAAFGGNFGNFKMPAGWGK